MTKTLDIAIAGKFIETVAALVELRFGENIRGEGLDLIAGAFGKEIEADFQRMMWERAESGPYRDEVYKILDHTYRFGSVEHDGEDSEKYAGENAVFEAEQLLSLLIGPKPKD